MRKLFVLITICILSFAAFTGCGIGSAEPSVDMSTLTDCGEETFINALVTVGIPKEKHTIHKEHAFNFPGDETEYIYEYCLEATADNENYFAYVRCSEADAAQKLFVHFYNKYKDVWTTKGFKGAHSEGTGETAGYVLINGKLIEKDGRTYTAYHDALYFKDRTVIIMMASDNRSDIQRQIDNLCKEIGCEHP
ncbi:MAG: hypothetical protein IKT20_03880 [Clostridiales bacterium]|nr:hypothetical protein [Clostridiales bacterium]